MSNVEIVVRCVALVMGLCLLVFTFAAVRCLWHDRWREKRAATYRDRQLDCLQMLRDEHAATRRARIFRQAMRFGRSNPPRPWPHELLKPAARPFEEDFGGTMGNPYDYRNQRTD